MQGRLLERVRSRLRNGEWTERAFARASGLSQSHVNKVLKGTRALSTVSMDLIFSYLTCSVLDLFTESELQAEIDKRRIKTEPTVELSSLSAPLGPGMLWNPAVRADRRFLVPCSVLALARLPVAAQVLGSERITILDLSPRAWQTLDPGMTYAVECGRGTFLKKVRRGRNRFYIFDPGTEDFPLLWQAEPLNPHPVRASVVWQGLLDGGYPSCVVAA